MTCEKIERDLIFIIIQPIILGSILLYVIMNYDNNSYNNINYDNNSYNNNITGNNIICNNITGNNLIK